MLQSTPPPTDTTEARAPVDEWIAAFNAGDVERILATYTPEALVLGTFSNGLTADRATLRDYLAAATAARTQVALGVYQTITTSHDAITFVGFYDFALLKDGGSTPLPARFSFLVVKRDGRWLIAHQHSSIRPKG